MEIGRTFEINGQTYAIKKVTGDRVDASKIIGTGPAAHIQRGRPCKFTYRQVAEALGEVVPEVVPTPEAEDEWIPPVRQSSPEEIQSLIDSLDIPTDTTTDDW